MFGFAFTALTCLAAVALAASTQEASVPDATQPRPETISHPAVIEFKGEINQKLFTYFKNRFAAAESAGADLLIIEIDSPGGLKIESLKMARQLRDCDWAYTVALVSNEAISGGALVSLGCDEILIDPNAKFGDAGEIGFDPEQWAWRLIEPKIESYLSRDARDLAQSKGRPADLAEAMVDKDVLVYIRPNPDIENGKPQFTAVRSDSVLKPDAPWRLVPESGAERFLTLSGQRAVELGMAQGAESTREEAATSFDFDINKLRVFRPTATDSVVYYLNLPWITGLLVLLGLVALYFELSSPGLGVGGLLAGLCAVLFFWSRFLGGTSGWLEIILFVAGIVFLFTEVFVIPGFGVPGITGLALLFSSTILASQDFVFPQTAEQWNQSLTSMLIILCSGCGFLVMAVFISKRMGSLPVLNRMVLAPPPIESDADSKLDKQGKPIARAHPMVSVGDWGRAASLLRPAGRAKFGGHSVDVISDGAFVEPDTQVRVLRINGNIITVTAVDDDEDLKSTTLPSDR
jgi:membrane-bound serine protease (ClpP class)